MRVVLVFLKTCNSRAKGHFMDILSYFNPEIGCSKTVLSYFCAKIGYFAFCLSYCEPEIRQNEIVVSYLWPKVGHHDLRTSYFSPNIGQMDFETSYYCTKIGQSNIAYICKVKMTIRDNKKHGFNKKEDCNLNFIYHYFVS